GGLRHGDRFLPLLQELRDAFGVFDQILHGVRALGGEPRIIPIFTSASASPDIPETRRIPRTGSARPRGASRSGASSASHTWDTRARRRRTFPEKTKPGAFFLLSFPYQPTDRSFGSNDCASRAPRAR